MEYTSMFTHQVAGYMRPTTALFLRCGCTESGGTTSISDCVDGELLRILAQSSSATSCEEKQLD